MSVSLDSLTKPANTAPNHLGYLDGLRGLAALYVVLHHAVTYFSFSETAGGIRPALNNTLPASLEPVAILFNMGRWAVPVFIALSGFCLMLPVVKSQGKTYSTFEFLMRRAKRLLPPYYFTLAFTMLLTWLFLSGEPMEKWFSFYTITPFQVWTHVLLIHDVFPSAAYRISYPLWSIATEWHIYFAFPPLIYLANRFGFIKTLTAGYIFCFALNIILYLLIRHLNLHGLVLNVIYLGVFISGMLAAHISYSPQVSQKWKQFPWGITTIVLLLVFVGLQIVGFRYFPENIVGFVVISLLIYMATRTDNMLHRFMGSKIMVGLGIFSYSLYLIHAPLLQISWHHIFSRWDASPTVVFWAFHLLTIPVIILISYLFHCCFERPFFNKKHSSTAKTTRKLSEA